jgi:pimeloyl-ACP methyl ester carboxylesterase
MLELLLLAVDPPTISYDAIFADTVRRGTLVRRVDGYGEMHPPVAEIRIASGDVRVGMPALVDAGWPAMTGHVSKVTADRVSITIDHPPENLRERRVAAQIEVDAIDDALSLSANPSLKADSSIGLFKIAADGLSASRVTIRTGRVVGHRIVIREGAAAGDRLILSKVNVGDDVAEIRLVPPKPGSPPAPPKGAGDMVDAGGYKIRMLVQGSGEKAVILIYGGFGGRFEAWTPVADRLKDIARVVMYDRGGHRLSEPAPAPRDSKHLAAELHTALKNAGVAPPYVIVGTSMGAIHARVFAHDFPKDTAGLVLIDPTAEDYGAQSISTAGMSDGYRLEAEMMATDFQQARESWPLPATTIITSLHPGADLMQESPMRWLDVHDAFAEKAKATHIVTEKHGHNVQDEDPAYVAEIIRKALKPRE